MGVKEDEALFKRCLINIFQNHKPEKHDNEATSNVNILIYNKFPFKMLFGAIKISFEFNTIIIIEL